VSMESIATAVVLAGLVSACDDEDLVDLTDASPYDASIDADSPDAESLPNCERIASEWISDVERLIANGRACSQDTDCAWVSSSAECSNSFVRYCGVAVSSALQEMTRLSLLAQNERFCAAYGETHCVSSTLCSSALVTRCRAGQCRYEFVDAAKRARFNGSLGAVDGE
jgi:hypothetical protein